MPKVQSMMEIIKIHLKKSKILKHEIFGENSELVEYLEFGQEDTSINRMCYFLLRKPFGTYLIVTGDLGDATYWWTGKNSLKWISGVDVGYFASKCTASETGKGFKDWDDEIARVNYNLYVENAIEEESINYSEIEDHYESLEYFLKCAEDAMCSQQAWVEFVNSERGCMEAIHGPDFGEIIYDVGETLHPRCIAHLAGLQMAFAESTKEVANER